MGGKGSGGRRKGAGPKVRTFRLRTGDRLALSVAIGGGWALALVEVQVEGRQSVALTVVEAAAGLQVGDVVKLAR